ncbi:MAG: hypothetical protein IKE33_05900 [Erysipelotrichaceae bacterium]|nr:hypothetical protein [Erysipelotrichaceae bacterium]
MKESIRLLSKYYYKARRNIDNGVGTETEYYAVKEINNSIRRLDPTYRFIIENEIINGCCGDWYLGFMSKNAYFSNRKKAYREFLSLLD